MMYKRAYICFNFPKTSALCALIFGIAYIFKDSKINKYLRFSLNKWLFKKHLTHIVSSNEDASFAVSQLKRRLNEKKVLGLDCEWVSVKKTRSPVALLQLASADGFCALFQLSSMKGVPSELAVLLEDKDILKVGVAVVTDARYLLADYGVQCEGCLDLRFLASQVDVEPRGLAYLANDLFGVQVDKDWRIRCSNWESEKLSSVQVQYAAQDASIAVYIFETLNHKKICKTHSLWKRLFWSNKDYWHHTWEQWSAYIGRNFTERSGGNSSNSAKLSNRSMSKPPGLEIKRNYSTLLQKQHYANIFLLAPDNQVLCTINQNKADWYIEKQLADVVCEEPKTLKLKFEPSRRTKEPDGYYTKPKENKCVVCGSKNDLRRKNVVPQEYRKHFEEEVKNHNSHDVLLMCLPCHVRSNMYDQVLRDKLVVECDAPLADGKNSKFQEMPELRHVKSAARALYFSGSVIPTLRRAELTAVVCDKLGVSADQLTDELLEEVIDIECFVLSDKYVSHGQKVVQHYTMKGGERGVEELERRWRQNFVSTMSPKYLPQLWSVNYTHG